jgi:S1-C subfamily serine protease
MRVRGRLIPLLMALLVAPAVAAAQQCPQGLPRTATLGIGFFHCVGGGCSVNVRTARGLTHDFSAEPRVWNLDPRGPAAGRLREGDVITAVDGALVTTPEGGRRLANLRPDRPVSLRVRRGGEEMAVRVVPAAGCNTPGLVVSASASRPEWKEHVPGGGGSNEYDAPPLRFGMQIECGDCGWKRGDGGWEFRSGTALFVKSVEPGSPAGRAGVRTGDVLLSINGRAFTGAGGVASIRGLRPGQPIRVELQRDGRAFALSIVPIILRRDEL